MTYLPEYLIGQNITSVFIPSTVTQIEYFVTINASSLETITVNENNPVYSSYDGMLYSKDKTNLILAGKAITGEHTLCPSIMGFSWAPFQNATGEFSIILPEGLTMINNGAFMSAMNMTSITLSSTIKEIGEAAFHGCGGLKEIIIPEGVTKIGTRSFMFCSGLQSIVLPKTIISIGNDAFIGCDSLTTIFYTGTPEDFDEMLISDGNVSLTSATVYFYSETAPTQPGNYWHYVEGVPIVWGN